jgi:hypothetical protein
MRFGMTILPTSRRVWRWVGVQLIGFCVLFIGASYYVTSMPGHSYSGPLKELSDADLQMGERLKAHVEALSDRIGERNMKHFDALTAAREYVSKAFFAKGIRGIEYPKESIPDGFGFTEQSYPVEGKMVKNIEIEIKGWNPSEIVIVGAHYDSVSGSPGANDNASGVGALLELADRWKDRRPNRTIRFVAFVNEEPPYFQTEQMGSRVYARRCRERGENITAMISLETIGYYSDDANSQMYPFPFSMFYPSKGDFIGFVRNTSSRSLVRQSIGIFRATTEFPSQGVAAPGFLTGIGWSDQWSFWKVGYPGIMITDTAIFRYSHYHRRSDTADKLNYDRLARVVSGIDQILIGLTK